MADKKGGSKVGRTSTHKKGGNFKSKRKNSSSNKKHKGPRLPNSLRKEVDVYNPTLEDGPSDSDDVVVKDLYEYEEDLAEEDSKKNKRFDPVENYQYDELPEDFEDENIASDDEDGDDNGDDGEFEDDERHTRMLQGVTGLPSDAFSGKKKKDFIVTEAYPESEFNPSRDILDGGGKITMDDLLASLHEKPGIRKLKHDLDRMANKHNPTLVPLSKAEQERVERRAAYEHSKKDITKWEPLVKRNREASTLYFDEDVDVGLSTIGAIASVHEPRTDFEKKMAALVNQNDVVEAHKNDGARLLELNKVSFEEVKNRRDHLAKMRSLLFRHEIKSKRIKKIKSKTYHRLLKKDRKKAGELAPHDPEAAKELAMKQEYKRAEERMTLKHKNTSKWAKHILKRGLQVQDEGTKEAFSEQLNQHAQLTRKMNLNGSSSSDGESSDGESDYMSGSDEDVKLKLLTKAKEKTVKVLEEDEEVPTSGLGSLPFMKRSLQKKKEAALQEANAAMEEYEASLNQLDDNSTLGGGGASNGRQVFGLPQKVVVEQTKVVQLDNYFGNSDSESDIEPKEDLVLEHNGNNTSLREADIDPSLLHEAFEINHDSIFKNFEGVAEDPEPKTMYEVSYLASDSWKKMKRSSEGNKQSNRVENVADKDIEDLDSENESDSDSGEDMVDGILSSVSKYELPSQAELIQRAFAGDDVEDDFEKNKEAVLDEENPQPEKPEIVPGWGQWTDVQKKKGLPSWMLKEHEVAKKKREESLKKRKDARLHNVIISEKLDKKAEKLHTKTLPYPFTSKEVFEQSIRMPIGPEFNPVSTVGALNRPEVVKKSGVIINPIQFEEMNHHHERAETNKQDGQKHKKEKRERSENYKHNGQKQKKSKK